MVFLFSESPCNQRKGTFILQFHNPQKEIVLILTNNIPDCEGKDAFGVSISLVFQTFPEQKEPSLKNVFPWSVNSGSLG